MRPSTRLAGVVAVAVDAVLSVPAEIRRRILSRAGCCETMGTQQAWWGRCRRLSPGVSGAAAKARRPVPAVCRVSLADLWPVAGVARRAPGGPKAEPGADAGLAAPQAPRLIITKDYSAAHCDKSVP